MAALNRLNPPMLPPPTGVSGRLLAPRSRRHFVKLFAAGVAASAFGSRPWRAPVLAALTPPPTNEPAVLRVNLADYPHLQQIPGSLRLSVNPITPNPDSYPLGLFYPVLITRVSETQFYAMDSQCTHAGCVVSSIEYGRLPCLCHGSQYDLDGTVIQGPANRSLTRYELEFDGVGTLTIRVPLLGYNVAVALAQNQRFQLCFNSFPLVKYNVLKRTSLAPGSDWTPVSFATTAGGALSQMEFTGDGGQANLYVDASDAGAFFAVSLVLLNYG
jgi:Rieske Fe-S protein